AVRQLDGLEETHVWTVRRQGTGNPYFCPCFQELRRDSDAAELRHSVRLADVFSSPAVLVDRVDVEVAVRIPRFVLPYRARDVDASTPIEVRRETVMRCHIGCGQHDTHDACGRSTKRNS